MIQILVNSIIDGSIYSLIAIGFAIIYKTVKFFHFAHGVIYTVGAYLAYTFLITVKFPFIIAIALAIVLTTLIGVAVEQFVYAPLRGKKASNLIFLLASFGVFIFMQNLIQLFYGAQILTIRTGLIKEGHHILGAVITDIQIVILVVSLLVFAVIWWFVQKTRLGKAIRAVSDDTIASSVVGINPNKIIITVFVIGSALAAIAGILISYETNIEPTMGFNAILKGIIASIIGGIGSIPGAVLGGLFLGLAENLGIWKIQAGWKDLIAFAIMIIFLLFRPSGIMGIKTEKEQI